jgi:hypothetical protein
VSRYQQATRHPDGIDPMHILGWILFVAGAAVVVFVIWFVLQAFLGIGTYIETVIP